MADVRIYTTERCPFCHSAKVLLRSRGIPYEEIDLTATPEARDRLVRRTGRMTFPQILIGERPIGGFEELVDLAHRGQLTRALAQAAWSEAL